MINKPLFLILLSTLSFSTLSAMKVSGNLTIARPTSISVETVEGKILLSVSLEKNGDFVSEEVELVPDVYVFKVGDSKENVFLDNTDITIKGFLDPKSAEKSQLEFTGIELNEKFQVLFERYKTSRGDVKVLKGFAETKKATSAMLSALAYLEPLKTYEDNKLVFDYIPQGEVNNITYKWLKHQTDSLYKYRIGGPAFNFSFVDENGKQVKLSDFKGKYVLLDFWASWCGPCIAEIRKLKNVYPEYADKNIAFVSVSVDDTKADWEKGLKNVQIPWIKLWDSEGGGLNKTSLKSEYGFTSIPFVMLIDKEGNVIARKLRGVAVEQEISKLELN